MYKYDKDKLKNSLTLTQVADFLAELGGEPKTYEDKILSKTVCHCGQSHKLYYYENTRLFKCFTDCGGESFDVFDLVCRHKNNSGDYKTYYNPDGLLAGRRWELFDAVEFVANYFGYSEQAFSFDDIQLKDWKVINNYKRINAQKEDKKEIQLDTFSNDILKYFPKPEIAPWSREGISHIVTNERGVCYNPCTHGVIIPHYNIDGDIVGIRERTLIKENEKFGKYRPSILQGKMYNHPLGYNLYNLNFSKEAIKNLGRAIVFEGEKSCLKYASYFGLDNDISVASCGSSLIAYQVQLLLDLGVNEIIVAYDKQYQQAGDKEWQKLTQNFYNIHDKYGRYVHISFIYDADNNRLGYKESPIDAGPDVFMELYNERITIE